MAEESGLQGSDNRTSGVRIALLLAQLEGAGIQRMRLNLLEDILQRGYAVDLVVGDGEGPLRDSIPQEAAVFSVAARGGALFPLGILRYLHKRRPTHIMSAYEDITVMTIIACRLIGCRATILASTHNALSKLPLEGGLLKRLKYRLLFPAMRWLYPRADSLVAVSRGVVDELERVVGVPRNRVRVIYNPVIGRDFAARAAARAPPALDKYAGAPLIGFFGRLHSQKAVHILIEAFALLRRERPCTLLLVGEGGERAALETLARELGVAQDVIFWGFADNPYPLIKACDLTVLPSAYEGLGNVIIESMACGVQVVTTDCPHGPAEIVAGGEYGQLVPVGDVEAMAAAIRRSLNREFWVPPELLVARGQMFSSNAATDRYLDALGLPPSAHVTN